MAGAKATAWGADVEPPATNATVGLSGMDVFVDLKDFIDVDAEITRNENLLENTRKQIKGKEGKLGNENFVARAPADVVQRERESLDELKAQLTAIESALENLREMKDTK